MPISRMQNPRQLYGLGSIVKSIGKGVKSFVGSPIGKAAILGFGANALMGGGGLSGILGKMGMTQPGSGFGGGSGIMGMFGKAKNLYSNMTGMQKFAGGTAIAALMSTGMGEEQAQATSKNPEALKQYLAQYYSNLNKNATQAEVNNFVNTNTSEYRANGGRIGYADGSDPVILPKAKPKESDGKKVLDLLAKNMKASQNTLGSKTLFNLMGKNAAKAYKAGDISKSQYDSMMKPFFGEPSERLSKKISEERKELKANGGRIGFNEGSLDPKIREIVIDLMDNEGFEFGEAVEEAYKRVEKSNGGRIRYSDGTGIEGVMAGEDYSSSAYRNKLIDTLMDTEGLDYGAAAAKADWVIKVKLTPKTKAANGGRIGLKDGTDFENYLKGKKQFQKQQNSENEYREYLENKRRQDVANQKQMVANGGRIGFNLGGDTKYNVMVTKMYIEAGGQEGTGMDIKSFADQYFPKMANGGRIGYAYGGNEIVDQASGIMGLPQRTNGAGIKELDLRDSGGFIPPVGVKEKADDVPAMLSNNEFVMTADAVRGMGGGDVNRGAQRLYDQMKMLEKGGRV